MFQALQDILKHKKQAANWTKSAQVGLVLSGFKKEVAKFLVADSVNRVKALHISEGRLVVACLDEDLVAELKKYESEIVADLNRLVSSSDLIKQIYFLE